MPRKDLKNKPLVEAMLELRWVLPDQPRPGIQPAPHYRLLLGRFSERAERTYPVHEPLPTAEIPDGMVAHMVQHRFRVAENDWPLLQIGPGIMTVNDTAGYTWTGFQKRCEEAVSHLFGAHPARQDFRVQDLTLRYVDAVAFDFNAANIFDFLRDKMKTTLALPTSLFEDADIRPDPSVFNWEASFNHNDPGGTITLRFATGERDGAPSLIWQTLVKTAGDDLPGLPTGFPAWLKAAHEITDDWFFKLIEGELERTFSGD